MQKREQKFTTKFLEWVRENYPHTSVFEVKDTRGKKTFPIREIYGHQLRALRIAKHGTLTHKISDAAIGFKPFDCFSIVKSKAFIVINYPDLWCMIDIDDFDALLIQLAKEGKKSIDQKTAERHSLIWR